MRRVFDALVTLAVVLLVFWGAGSIAANISSWDVTLPDGAASSPTGLNELDDYIRDRTSDIQTWVAVEHADNGTHVLPYGTTAERNAYDNTYATTGNIFWDSDTGYAYRWSGTAWVRIAPIGLEATFTTDTSPSADEVDRMNYTGAATITDIDDGYVGQMVMIRNTNGANTVTIDHDGSALCTADGLDFSMSTTGDVWIAVQWADGAWREVGRIEQ